MISFFNGLSFGASLIMAIGAQNAFVIRQALRRRHLFAMALLCAVIDASLILLGVFGFGALIERYTNLLALAKYFAIMFLIAYGALAFRAALKDNYAEHLKAGVEHNLRGTLLAILAFSLLNPHVYLDTVVLLGSIAAQEAPPMQKFFALGAITASFLWFFALSYTSSLCARWLTCPKTQRWLDATIAITMWGIATRLFLTV